MYCRTDKAPSLTMGYSNLEKTWWQRKKAHEKIRWHHKTQEKGLAVKRDIGHLQ